MHTYTAAFIRGYDGGDGIDDYLLWVYAYYVTAICSAAEYVVGNIALKP